jgi:hypothetical protein
MVLKRLLVLFGLYTLLAAGVTVAPLAYLYGGPAVVVLLMASIMILPALHAQAGTSVGAVASDFGSGEGSVSMDLSEQDFAPTAAEVSSYLPHKNRGALSFYLLGVIVYSLAALAYLLG